MFELCVNLILAILTILDKSPTCEIYNVANYKSAITIKDLALKLIEKYKTSSLKIEIDKNNPYPKNTHLKLNTNKIEALGWNAKIDLDEMFERLIKYLKKEME